MFNSERLTIALWGGFLVLMVLFSLMMAFRPTAIQSIETHNMPNGVTCYTFNTNIDCLKIGE